MENINIQIEKELRQIVESHNSKSGQLIKSILNKNGKDLEKSHAQVAVLAYILPELMTHGCIIRTTTQEIAEACNCKTTVVNNVLGFAGFKYERDKVTHKDADTKGLFERYYQFEYTDTGATKRTSSVFNIVATQKLFDLLRDELGVTITVDEEELAKLHADSKAKAYTKSVKRETVVITYTKETTVFTTANGTTTSVNYTGVDNAINELQSLQTVEEPTDEDLLSEFSNEELMEIANRQYPLEERIINIEFEDEMPTNETMEENVQVTPSTDEMEDVFDDDILDDLDCDFDEEPEAKQAVSTFANSGNIGKHGFTQLQRTNTEDESKSNKCTLANRKERCKKNNTGPGRVSKARKALNN